VSQVLCEHVSRVFVSLYIIESNLSVLNHLTNEVVAYMHMLNTLFLDRIGCHKDGSLVVSVERYGFQRVAYLF
jgi:hypothetical protein